MHIAVDDHSRCAYMEALPDQTGATAAAFLERARPLPPPRRGGVPPSTRRHRRQQRPPHQVIDRLLALQRGPGFFDEHTDAQVEPTTDGWRNLITGVVTTGALGR